MPTECMFSKNYSINLNPPVDLNMTAKPTPASGFSQVGGVFSSSPTSTVQSECNAMQGRTDRHSKRVLIPSSRILITTLT